MRTRIEALVPNAGGGTLLTTFHSFAGDILRQHGHLIGLRPDFTIITQEGKNSRFSMKRFPTPPPLTTRPITQGKNCCLLSLAF